MAIKMKRCLYIGLGGTGMNAILRTKKKFIDTYGEVPPMIGFLGIDTDGDTYNKSIDGIRLMPSEQVSISGRNLNPKEFIQQNEENFGWLPEGSLKYLSELGDGAGQIRTNGRVAFLLNAEKIQNSIQSALDQIRNIRIVEDDKYEIVKEHEAKDEIHLTFSLSGGTGAGTFIDAAYVIRHVTGTTAKIAGYAVLPEVFKSMVKTGVSMDGVRPNAYSAICDLDYLMNSPHEDMQPVIFDHIHTKLDTKKRRPFDAMYIINNQNGRNVTFDHVNDICEMISLVLLTSSGAISGALTSTLDNVESMMRQEVLNVGNKLAWVSGIGACEIIFKSKDLKEVYTYKAAQRLIELMINSCEDTNRIANDWIDNKDVDIRENDGSRNDKVIDRFGKANPKMELPLFEEIKSSEDVKSVINHYLNNAKPQDGEQKNILNNLCAQIKVELEKKVKALLNIGDCGVSTAEGFLQQLVSQVDLFLKEMMDEKAVYEKNMREYESNLKESITICEDEFSKFSLFKGKRHDAFDSMTGDAEALVIATMEKDRRDYAIKFFNDLKGNIADQDLLVNKLKSTLIAVHKQLINDLAAIQNLHKRTNPITEINLAEVMLNNISISDGDLLISQFPGALPSENLFNLSDPSVCRSSLLDYCEKLQSARNFDRENIDTVLNDMDNDTFKRLMEEVDIKATPLLQIDGRGRKTNNNKPIVQAINRYYYVGVPDINSSRFVRNDVFKSHVGGAAKDISFINSGMKDRVIVYRQEGCVPAFAIQGLDVWKAEYDRRCKDFFYHFDQDIRNRMVDENHSLFPMDEKLAQKALEYWIMALIFGFVRRTETGEYEYLNKQKGKATKKYWCSMETKDRVKAFRLFSRELGCISTEYDQRQEELQHLKDWEELQSIKNDAKENYLEKYSLNRIPLEQIEREPERYCKLEEQLEAELRYIENDM